ncbi:MAG: 23S rRNA (uracil(1939)-C(5))-methyltransferase RlmD [Clostridiales bacterium]|jgi:23S rRNA (uracil1939-C5)-methyltransferase|nr:23S rRNA (uracil(1939)-C(5))-methyltransferase RlmD [Clostridiales bacterium]
MKAGDIIKLDIADIGCNTEGVARCGDIITFVPFVDLGEEIEAEITHINKNYIFAQKTKLIKASPCRVEPPCVYFEKCGGCDCQHLSYERQLAHKEKILRDTLSKFLDVSNINFLPIRYGDKRYGYRNKLQIPVSAGGGGKAVIGFFEKDSHKPVDMNSCVLHGEWAAAVIKGVRRYMSECGVAPYDERSRRGVLRHIVARKLGDYLSVTLVINDAKLPKYSKLADIIEYSIRNIDGIKGFSLHYSVNMKNTNVILGDNITTVCGYPLAPYEILGIKTRVSPLSFMQINDGVRDMIYQSVASLAEGADTVIDAYSGGGALTALLSKKARTVYGIEIAAEAVADADGLVKSNGIQNVKNICGDAADALPSLIARLKGGVTVVLDPPRKGCEKSVIDALTAARCQNIVYISCNPATLARDLSLLSKEYNTVSVEPYDMFPSTKHIETLAYLTLKAV